MYHDNATPSMSMQGSLDTGLEAQTFEALSIVQKMQSTDEGVKLSNEEGELSAEDPNLSPHLDVDSQAMVFPADFMDFRRTMDNDPKWGKYNPETWRIVPVETCALTGDSIGPDHEHENEEFSWVQWPRDRSSTEQVFTQFPNLPKEVREMIYQRALPEPRILRIMSVPSVHPNFGGVISVGLDMGGWQFRDLAMACKESLDVFQRNYKRLKVNDDQYGARITYGLPYIDLKRDTIVVEHGHLEYISQHHVSIDFGGLCNLALAGIDLSSSINYFQFARAICQNLKNLTFAVAGRDGGWDFEARLINIDTSLRYATFTPIEDGSAPVAVGNALDDLFALSDTAKAAFLAESQLVKTGIKFNTCALMIAGPSRPMWYVKQLELAPANPIPYHMSFMTLQPIEPCFVHDMLLEHGDELRIFSSSDTTTLHEEYDGIRELFEGMVYGGKGVVFVKDMTSYLDK